MTGLRRWARANPDLAVFAALLVLTACFGRPFSKIGAGGLYITEVALAAIIVLALRRTGFRGAFDRIRRSVPLVALGLLWLGGAIAALRGLDTYGLSATIKDVGLVEYSIFVPLVAVLADTRARADALVRTLSYAGLAATAVFAVVFFFAPNSPIGVVENPTSAVGIYLALWVLPVAARLMYGERPANWELGVAAGAVLLMAFGAGRSVLVALLAALIVLGVLSPRPLRTAAIGFACIALSVGAVVGLQTLGFGDRGLAANTTPPVSVDVASSLVLDDELQPAVGGKVVTIDAERGRASREAQIGEAIEIPYVTGLVPGAIYTVSFAVKPLDPLSNRGIAGNNAGTGWSMVFWHAQPDRVWQRLSVRLRATAPVERLMFVPDRGVLGARFDSVRITRDASGSYSEDALDRKSNVSGPMTITRTPPKESTLLSAIVDSFDPRAATGEYLNANWRLHYWRALLDETFDEPVLGVGFGHPAAFPWRGVVYDTREPGGFESLSPPHNSFVNLFYRTGLVGLAGLIGLLAVALVRMSRLFRATETGERPPLVALLALFTFISVVAALNVALEGPYMAMFFWTVLGLMLTLPRVLRRAPIEG